MREYIVRKNSKLRKGSDKNLLWEANNNNKLTSHLGQSSNYSLGEGQLEITLEKKRGATQPTQLSKALRQRSVSEEEEKEEEEEEKSSV